MSTTPLHSHSRTIVYIVRRYAQARAGGSKLLHCSTTLGLPAGWNRRIGVRGAAFARDDVEADTRACEHEAARVVEEAELLHALNVGEPRLVEERGHEFLRDADEVEVGGIDLPAEHHPHYVEARLAIECRVEEECAERGE